jgi:hypothetical protein
VRHTMRFRYPFGLRALTRARRAHYNDT